MRSPSKNNQTGSAYVAGSGKHTYGLGLWRNFTWTLIGNVIYATCQWALLMSLAKIGSPKEVGQFALAFAVTAPIIMLASLQLRSVQATDACMDYKFSDYLALRLFALAAACVVIPIIAFASRYSLQTALAVMAIGLAKVFESISDVIYGLLQQHEHMDRIAISMSIKGIVSVGAFVSVFYYTKSVLAGALALALAWAIILWLYDLRSGRMILQLHERAEINPLRPKWHWPTMLKLARLSLPLGLVIMMISLHTSLPRYFLERYTGQASLGIFAAMSYLFVIGTTVVGALGQASSPRLAKYYATGQDRQFHRLLIILFRMGLLLGVGVVTVSWLWGRQILSVAYKPEYAKDMTVFIWMAVGYAIGFIGSFLGYAVTSTRQFDRLTIPSAITTLVALICCFTLIARFELIGAAWTICAISIANLVTTGFILLKVMKGRADSN